MLDSYLDKAFELNWDQTKGIFENYTEFEYLQESDFAKTINERWEKSAKDSGINLELMAEFKEIQRTDQEQRGYMREIQDKYGWDSPQMDSLWKIQTAADEVHLLYTVGELLSMAIQENPSLVLVIWVLRF